MTDDSDEVEHLTREILRRFGVNAMPVARLLDEIADAMPDIPRTALEMIDRFGDAAAYVAREMADITVGIPDMQYGEVWCDIADSIEGLQLELMNRGASHLH
jgi:hypothetical protein